MDATQVDLSSGCEFALDAVEVFAVVDNEVI